MSGEIYLEFAKNNVKIYSIELKGDDVEEYFMKLIRGNNYA